VSYGNVGLDPIGGNPDFVDHDTGQKQAITWLVPTEKLT